MIGKSISHYKILEKLGEGGMGVVYKAEDTNLKRTVALKFLSPQVIGSAEDKTRFVREAQVAASLEHPNICTVYEIAEAEGHTFIAMAYIDGKSLKDKIEARPMKIDEALDIATQVAQGLQEAHEKGIIHRDIKSANIMLTAKGQAKITDFGLAKQAGRTRVTKEGVTLGTIAYMSPEQARGEIVDHRTDIWSFGVMLYEMVTGQLPFKGVYEQAVVYSILNEVPEPMTGLRTGVPMELERIVNKAMAKNPDERYQHVDEMLIDLRAVAKEIEVGTSKARSAATTRQAQVTRVSLLKDLLNRRVPQIVGVYLGVSWGVIQFVAWLVSRYPLSPNLPDFTLAALASMIPTVLLLAYFHGKPGLDQWTGVEKFGIPANLLAAVVLLFFVFKGKDLGAATKTVTLQDEEGKTIERVVPKSEFRKKVAIFYFENDSGDSTLNWLRYGIVSALASDLAQDIYLNIGSGFPHELKEAGFQEGIGAPLTLKKKIATDEHYNYFVTGAFAKQNGTLEVKTTLYETKLSKPIAGNFIAGTNIFQLADSMSVQLKHDLTIPTYHIEATEDLPVSERLTYSLPAFKMYIAAHYAIWHDNDYQTAVQHLENAVKDDSAFAYAYRYLNTTYASMNQSEKADKALLAAMRHIYKLSESSQFRIKYDYYAMKEDTAKQFALLKNWVELYPEDTDAHSFLAGNYRIKNQLDEAISEYKRILELDPEQYDYLQTIGSVYKLKGQFDEALKYYKQYAGQFPNDYESFTAIGDLYKTMGNYEQAKANYEKALLIEPEEISILLESADIDIRLGNFKQVVDQYQEALKISKTPQHRMEVYRALEQFYQLRGQISKSLEYYHLGLPELQKSAPPLIVSFLKINLVFKYLEVGKKESAFQTIQSIEAQLTPPLDKLLPVFYVIYYVKIEDADNAEKAFSKIESLVQKSFLTFYGFDAFVLSAQGMIQELRNEHEQAIQSYRKVAEMNPTEVSINVDIGRCLRNLREFTKAEESLQRTLKIRPFDPEAHYEIALVYFDMGKKEKALEHLKKALYVWEEADPEYKPAKKAREKLAEWEAVAAK